MARTKNGDNFSFDFSSLDFDKKSEEQMQEVPRLNTEPVMFENAKQMAIKTDWSKDYFCFVAGSFIFGDYIEALLYAKRLKPSVVYITTLGLGKQNVDSIVNMVDYLKAEKVNIIVSHYFSGVERHNLIPYMEQEFKFKPVDVAVLQSHCKIALIKSDKGDCLITGSANLSSSNNVEQFIITHNQQAIDFIQKRLDNIMEKFTVIEGLKGAQMHWAKNKGNTGVNAYNALQIEEE